MITQGEKMLGEDNTWTPTETILLRQQNAELTHEILELREQVCRLETKEFLTYGTDDETAYDMDEIIHMSEVIKYLERKLKEQE